LKITNRSFRYAAPCSWNEVNKLPTDLREPRQIVSFTFTYHTWQFIIFVIFTIITCIFSYSFSLSFSTQDLALRQILSSVDLFLSYRTDFTDSRTFNVFILLNGWICLHRVLD